MHAGRGIHKLEIGALVSEEIQPLLQLKNAAVVLKPTEAKISPLSATRDVIPEGRQVYQNILVYNLNVGKAAEVALYAPLFNDLLYEAEFESQMWMLFDVNKTLVATGDAHSHTFFTKLEKGEYTVRLQVRHEKRELLEKISEANLIAAYKLANMLSFDFYDSYNQCIISGRKITSAKVRETTKMLYIAPIAQEKLTKANLPAQCAWLAGNLIFPKDEGGRRIALHPFTYILNPAEKKSPANGAANGAAANNASPAAAAAVTANGAKPKAAATPQGATSAANSAGGDGVTLQSEVPANGGGGAPSSPQKGKTSADDYAESLRDFQCSHIAKCGKYRTPMDTKCVQLFTLRIILELEKAEKIYNEVIAAHPKHLPAHLQMIQNIESSELKSQLPFAFLAAQQNSNNEGDNANVDKPKEDQQKQHSALERIIKLADIVIKETDADALLSYYGIKNDTRPDAAKIKT